MSSQLCPECKARGITKLVPPSQIKAHRLRMHSHVPAVNPTLVNPPVPEAPAKVPSAPIASAKERSKRWREKQKQKNPNFAAEEAKRKATERAEIERVKEIEKIRQSNPQPPFVMIEATQGKGLLVTGGCDQNKLDEIHYFQNNDGKKITPGGFGADTEITYKELQSQFAPKFPPGKLASLLRQFVYDCTSTNKSGEIVCVLCKEVLGGGMVRPDVVDREQVTFLHFEQKHNEPFQAFLKRLTDSKACPYNHEAMVLRHSGGSLKLQCGGCKKILWKPPKPPKEKKPKKPRSDKIFSIVCEDQK
jgi:hypothetical protein